jgi:hypothetical protein
MNDKETLVAFYKLRPELDVRANDGFLLEQATKPISIQSLTIAANQLESTLLITKEYQSAWDEFVFFNPEKNRMAFRRQFLDEMREKEIQLEAKHEYNTIFKELGREDLRGLPLETLRVHRENKRRKSLSASQLHELSQQENPAPTTEPDALPQFYTPIGKRREIELTADVIRRAGTRTGEISITDLKFLIRRFGSTEVNRRLGVKPAVQPGFSKALEI